MKLGIQLWSVRNEANADFKGTVEKLKAMGYEGVEIAGISSLNYFEMAEVLNSAGITAISAHIGLDEIENEEKLEGLKGLGLKYAAFNGMGISKESIPYLRDNFTRLGKICRENGIYLLYHNHDYEFAKIDEVPGLDLVYGAVNPKYLGAEIDTCWVKYAGIDPAEYIRKYKGRCPLIHIKDYNGGKKGEDFSYKAVGSGVMDVGAVINAAKAAGSEWIIVEQDTPEKGRTPMDSCKESAEFILNKTVLKYQLLLSGAFV